MDIFIKSFNRVYYLDRCLKSIHIYLENFNGKIYILDDGTPKVYLDALQLKYPDLIILKSDGYNKKSSLLEKQNFKLPEKIPSKFWFESVKKSSDYCLILEDDLWFTKTLDIRSVEDDLIKKDIILLKLLWLGNTNIISGYEEESNKNITIYKPDLRFKNSTVFKLVYTKYNALWRKILTLLKLYSHESELNYYSIYSVAGAIFKKDYFLSVWRNSDNHVNEKQQIIKALQFYNAHNAKVARTRSEVIKTGFISSAFMKKEYNAFSIHDLNITLNEYWLVNKEAFNTDFNVDIKEMEIETILKAKGKSTNYINQWKDWVFNFKESYRKIGCQI